jgi:hypothetical protein
VPDGCAIAEEPLEKGDSDTVIERTLDGGAGSHDDDVKDMTGVVAGYKWGQVRKSDVRRTGQGARIGRRWKTNYIAISISRLGSSSSLL